MRHFPRQSTLKLGKFKFLPMTAAAAALTLAGCSAATEIAEDPGSFQESAEIAGFAEDASLKPVADRNPAPSFEFTDQNGDPVTLDSLKGQVVLLNFWATWCAPCREEMPWFAEFEKEYKDRGFSVVGVSLDDEGWEKVNPYLEEHPGIDYRVVIGSEMTAQVYGGIASLPTTYIIDKEGRIAAVHTGLPAGGRPTYEQQIEELL